MTPDGSVTFASPVLDADAFDAFYYKHCCGQPYVRNDEWLRFFDTIADRIAADFAPRRVLDAGCAFGFLVEALRNRGVEAWGIDLSRYAIGRADPSVKPFCRVGSIADALNGTYDLVVCIEVVEHMAPRDADIAIANICAHTADVLFTSSPDDHREPTHVNVHPPEYWAERFARHGFYRDVGYDATYIVPWGVRFKKSAEPFHRIVAGYERRYSELLEATRGARAYSMEVQRQVEGLELDRDVVLDRLRRLEVEHAQALDTIHHMERSRFWQLRGAWLRLRQCFP